MASSAIIGDRKYNEIPTFADLENLLIEHELVTIRRYRESDLPGLEAIFERDFFTWFFTNYHSCTEFVTEKMAEYAKGNLVMMVVSDNKTGKIIGTSSLYEISFKHRRIEMGASWLASAYHGSIYNSLNKYLLIDYLINKLNFNRVQWKTDALNEKSKAAMNKLGFNFEGTLRRHAVTYTGRVRDSLVFSVTDLDWPQVAQQILARIEAKQRA